MAAMWDVHGGKGGQPGRQCESGNGGSIKVRIRVRDMAEELSAWTQFLRRESIHVRAEMHGSIDQFQPSITAESLTYNIRVSCEI